MHEHLVLPKATTSKHTVTEYGGVSITWVLFQIVTDPHFASMGFVKALLRPERGKLFQNHLCRSAPLWGWLRSIGLWFYVH